MNTSFQQQQPLLDLAFVRSAPSQQNGSHLDGHAAAAAETPAAEERAFEARRPARRLKR